MGQAALGSFPGHWSGYERCDNRHNVDGTSIAQVPRETTFSIGNKWFERAFTLIERRLFSGWLREQTEDLRHLPRVVRRPRHGQEEVAPMLHGGFLRLPLAALPRQPSWGVPATGRAGHLVDQSGPVV